MSYTPGVARVVAETHTLNSVVNTTTATNVFALTVPGGPVVAAGDKLRLVAIGDSLNSSGSSVNYTLALILGTTTVLNGASIGIASAANRRAWWLDVEIAISAVNAQIVGGIIQNATTAGGTNPWGNFTSTGSLAGVGTAAEDLSTAKTLALQVTMGTANANADFRVQSATVELLRKPV